MQQPYRSYFSRIPHRVPVILLIVVWILGLLIGVFQFDSAQDIASLMGISLNKNASIISLAAVTFLPLLLSAFAVYVRLPLLIQPIVFMKAFLVGLSCGGLVLAFGTSGWLMRLLLIFSDSAMLIPWLWFCIRHCTGNLSQLRRDLAICSFWALILCLLDRLCMSDFLTTLI